VWRVMLIVFSCLACQSSSPREPLSAVPLGPTESTSLGAKQAAATAEGPVLRVFGNGASQLRSPSVQLVQQNVEQVALDDAKKRLRSTLMKLAVASGETLGARSKKDKALASKLDKVVEALRVVDRRYYADGATDVLVEVSISALQDSLGPAPSNQATSFLLLDARNVQGMSLDPMLRVVAADSTLLLEKPRLWADSLDAAKSVGAGEVSVLPEDSLQKGSLLVSEALREKISKVGTAGVVIVLP
jgi:hypothetical protein